MRFQSKLSGITYKTGGSPPVENPFKIAMPGHGKVWAGTLAGDLIWYDEVNDIYRRFFTQHEAIDFTPYVREGKMAYENGILIEANPYDRKKDPVKHSLWHRGWLASTKNYEVPSDD